MLTVQLPLDLAQGEDPHLLGALDAQADVAVVVAHNYERLQHAHDRERRKTSCERAIAKHLVEANS